MAIRLLSSESIDGALTLTGNLTGTSATLTGALTGTSATFAGSITAAGGTMTSDTTFNSNIILEGNIFHKDDTNTYFGFNSGSSGDDTIVFATNNVQRLTIDSSGNSTFTGNILIGNTVTNPASGFADQTGIGLKYSTTVPEIQVSSDAAAMQLGRTTTGGDGQILGLRKEGTIITSFSTNASQFYNLTSGQTGTVVMYSEGGGEVGLTVQSRTNRGKIRVADNDSNAYVVAEAGKAFYGTSANGDATNITVLTSGSVGIGTISPTAKLDIGGNTVGSVQTIFGRGNSDSSFTVRYTNGITGTNDTVQGTIGLDYANGYWADMAAVKFIRESTSGELAFYTSASATSGVERMRIDNAGNVGIGVTSPGAILDVSYGISASQTAIINLNGDNGAAAELVMRAGGDDGGTIYNRRAAIRYYSNQISTTTAQWVNGVSMTQTTGDDNFYFNNSGNSTVLKLTQAGNAVFAGTITSGNITLNGSSRALVVKSSNDQVVSSFICDGSAISTIGFKGNTGANDYNVRIGADGSSLVAYTVNTVRMTINSSGNTTFTGNVGINTTSPDYKLDVNGSIRAGRVTTNVEYYSTTNSASNQYFHIKTSVNANSQTCMHTWSIEGYAYGSQTIIDCKLAFHTDSSNNIYGLSYLGSLANNIYRSGDNYVVLVFGTLNTYYTHFYVNLFEGMYTPLNSTVLAVAYSPNNSGVY